MGITEWCTLAMRWAFALVISQIHSDGDLYTFAHTRNRLRAFGWFFRFPLLVKLELVCELSLAQEPGLFSGTDREGLRALWAVRYH